MKLLEGGNGLGTCLTLPTAEKQASPTSENPCIVYGRVRITGQRGDGLPVIARQRWQLLVSGDRGQGRCIARVKRQDEDSAEVVAANRMYPFTQVVYCSPAVLRHLAAHRRHRLSLPDRVAHLIGDRLDVVPFATPHVPDFSFRASMRRLVKGLRFCEGSPICQTVGLT
ncbi:hypothetical protein [Gordonia hongkongensis]|uniref:Uncharacterized protein n=1 Tax=Gordonia hongkongensis TaxID=1701090 RepID=A0ABT6BNJ6_9ACTN|nr:hypothetical protein [Gordonia hongkongensis]MDF6099546.1 hypothetical protein [Gordonia hongkongensis]